MQNSVELISQVDFSQFAMTIISLSLPAFTNSFLETLLTSAHDQGPKPIQHVFFVTSTTSKYQFFFSCFLRKTVAVDCNDLLRIIKA